MFSLLLKHCHFVVIALVWAFSNVVLAFSSSSPFQPFHVAQDDKPDEQGQARYTWEQLPPDIALQRANNFYNLMSTRRTVRFFDPDADVPLELVKNALPRQERLHPVPINNHGRFA